MVGFFKNVCSKQVLFLFFLPLCPVGIAYAPYQFTRGIPKEMAYGKSVLCF